LSGWILLIQGCREVLFAELLSAAVHGNWDVGIVWGRESQQPLQVELAWRRSKQVRPAHDVSDLLKKVIDYYSQLIGNQAILAAQDKVSALFEKALLLLPLYGVHKEDSVVRHHNAQCSRAVQQLPLAAATIIDTSDGLNLQA